MLEGGCSVPVGIASALDTSEGGQAGVLKLTGCVTALDGQSHVEHTLEQEVHCVEEAEAVGAKLARTLIATGAKAILDDITKDREKRAAA